MAIRLQVRRDSSYNWSTNNPILQIGEFGFDVTNNRFKVGIGDGPTSRWNVLPYLNVIPSELKELAQDFVEEAITAGTGIAKAYNDQANTITISVDNTIANKTYVDDAVSALDNTAADTYIPINLLNNSDGVAGLDENGFLFDSQIPASIARDTEIASAISTEVANRNSAISTAVTTGINNLVNGAPTALNTLKELADAINDDASYAATVTTALGTKITASSSDTLTNKSINLSSNTLTGTKAQFNAAITDADFVTLAGTEELTNKTLNSPIINQPTGLLKGDVGLANVDNTSDNTKALLSYIAEPQLTRTINSSTDKNKMIECSVATTITIPNDTQDSGWQVGSMVEIRQVGSGQVTITKDGSVTMVGPDNQFKTRVQWSTIMLEKRSANYWLVTGDTTA
jgi:hypothetical protein